MTLDLRALQVPSAGPLQIDCVSAIAEAALRVGDPASALELRRPISTGESMVTFDNIEVEQGAVPLSVAVESDNDTELYGKDTVVQIDATTFDIPLTVEKRAPVLQVCPGHITLDREGAFQARLEVNNRGIDTLEFTALSPECPGGACIVFSPTTGAVDQGGTAGLIDSLIRMAPTASVEMRVQSPSGSVPIEVTLGALPDVVVDAFSATDTVRFDSEVDLFELPVSVTLRNDGNVAADIFKLAARSSSFFGTEDARFEVPDAGPFYPFIPAPLPPGEAVTLAGLVFWSDTLAGQFVRLHIESDSCRGDDNLGLPFFCRVDEFDEFNNLSQEIEVQLGPPIP